MAKVTVILTHQLDCNRKYLDLALRGLKNQSFKDFEVLVVSGAETDLPFFMGFGEMKARNHCDRTLDTGTKKIHWAIANSDSEYILLHSDDVVLAKDALGEMVASMDHAGACIMNPFSNSDCRSLYHADFGLVRAKTLETKTLIHDMDYADIEGWENEILDFPIGRRILLPVQTLSFYCTLIPRGVWQQVGELDPELEYRHNDQDFCIRARAHGIMSVVNLAPFAFHFGSKTLSHLADEGIKSKATAHFLKKHGGFSTETTRK